MCTAVSTDEADVDAAKAAVDRLQMVDHPDPFHESYAEYS